MSENSQTHALLSPSSAHRWFACPPSARLCEHIEEEHSEFAEEGTEAHNYCKMALLVDSMWYTEGSEMERCANRYKEYVIGLRRKYPNSSMFVDKQVDISKWVPESYGTLDCCIACEGFLHVIDYKYGIGIKVDAERNEQLMLYALGACEKLMSRIHLQTIRATIFQPRLEHVSTYEISAKELLNWAETVLKPIANLAFSGEGEFCSGAHCRFCKIKSKCRCRAEKNLELLKYDLQHPDLMKKDEIASIFIRIPEFTKWANDVSKYALDQALEGVKFPGLKLVECRGKRVITDEAAACIALEKEGVSGYLTHPKLNGITALENLLGKSKFYEILGDYILESEGKKKLVPEEDS